MAFNYKRKNAYDYDTVKKAQSDLNANSTYNKSDAVLAAERLKNEHEANKVADWTGGTYGQSVKDALYKINNREKFAYDLNGDALYQQYKDRYTQMGKQAMRDTMGQAAALTGGYGNILDAINMGKNSENSMAVREYMAQGMTEEKARQQVWKDNAVDILWAGYGGAISAGAMAAGGQLATDTVRKASNTIGNYSVGDTLTKNGRYVDLQEQANALQDHMPGTCGRN